MGTAKKKKTVLARMMILNAVVAVVLAASRPGFIGNARYVLIGNSILACLLVALLLNGFLDTALGLCCPRCRESGLRRLARTHSFVGYYQCSHCGNRCKRALPFSRWHDASGPEDAVKYARKPAAGRWLTYTRPEENDSYGGRLLRAKRSRAQPHPSQNPSPDQDGTSS